MSLQHRFRKLRKHWEAVNDVLHGLPAITAAQIAPETIQQHVDKPNPTILEIGCNDGIHTLWLRELFSQPSIFCFEPDPRAIARFNKNVGIRQDIQLFEVALGQHDGDVIFYQSSGQPPSALAKDLPGDWDQSGSIRAPKEHLTLHPWVKFEHMLNVAAVRLDTWCVNHAIDLIDFIWMDVQGAELDVFAGGKQTLKYKTRFIYTEYSNRELYSGQGNLKQLLRQLECFEVVARYPEDVLLRNMAFN